MAKLAEKEGINHKKADDSMFDWQGYPLKVIIGIALIAIIIFFSS